VRAIVAAVLLPVFVACTTLRPVPDANTYLSGSRPNQVWVRTGDGTVVLEGPRLLGDTLVGFVDGEYREFMPGEVHGVEVRQPAKWRTIALVSGLVVVGGVLVAVLASTGPSSEIPNPEQPPTLLGR